MAAVWTILAKTRFPSELIRSFIQQGVRWVSVPFQIAADSFKSCCTIPTRGSRGLSWACTPRGAFDSIIHPELAPVLEPLGNGAGDLFLGVSLYHAHKIG